MKKQNHKNAYHSNLSRRKIEHKTLCQIRKMLNKQMRIFVFICLFVFYGCANPTVTLGENKKQTLRKEELYAKSAILLDADSKRVLFEKDGYEPKPMASTTKIMTCLLALELADMEDEVVFSKYAASRPKVHLGVKAGSRFRMQDMLYSLMLESHNDTAVAIAETIAEDTLSFANLMNERAKKIGAKNTNFVTPNGLDDVKHYSTAYDLALITAEALKNKSFLEIIQKKNHTFQDIEGKHTYVVSNKNAFLSMMDGALGVKTGFTGTAGYCFVGALKRENRTFISVVLASGWPPNKSYKWNDTVKLMNYGIDHYEYKVIFDGIRNYKRLFVRNGKKNTVDTYIKGNASTLLSDTDLVEYQYELSEGDVLEAPVLKEQKVGKMHILINHKRYLSFDICVKDKVEKISYGYVFGKLLRCFLL